LQDISPINGNPLALQEMLTNLILNAVDAIKEDGIIALRTYSLGKDVMLEISDTGCGMTEEVKQRCLEPFFSTKTESGTGLGLPMAYGIIERHKGSIEINSTPGEGTTITIRFPALEQPAEDDVRQEAEPFTRPLHVLVVDDEQRVRDMISTYLTTDGHTFQVATNGQDGLDKFNASMFDVVITDQAMPEMNGVQLAKAIKKIAPNKPIIMLTGFGDMMKDDIPSSIDFLV
jgi:anti-sigma regulatory factor (Ser/Thr protein kinase)